MSAVMRLWGHRLLTMGLVVVLAPAARAGMPAPLPTGADQVRVLRPNVSVLERVEAISFFLVILLLCAAAVWGLWNYLRRDIPKLPRLSFGKALAGVLLWGLLFIIVLTMIAGARELMTPGAWQKQGFTYRLPPAVSPTPEPSPHQQRKQQLERLRTALWHFAATHNGRFPSTDETPLVPADLWLVPEGGGLRYQYVPGLSAAGPAALLVYEPELEPGRRLVLRTDGDIATVPSTEVESLRQVEKRP